jgi:CxxC motif-containing protein (DUF1111 family)
MSQPTLLRILSALAIVFASTTACSGGDGNSDFAVATSNLGQPIEGLTADQLAAFERGRQIYTKRFKASEGLGPLYNAVACSSCHANPVVGGSAELYRNFHLAAVGFPGFQFALPGLPSIVMPAFGQGPHATASFDIDGRRTDMPTQAFGLPVTIAQRNSLQTFGVGLFETVSDATILGNADPDDLDGDGISGRANTRDGRVGRFGTKAQTNNIELFTRGPLNNQMGITSDPFEGDSATASLGAGRLQVGANPNDPLTDNDGIPDPEISSQDLADLITFQRFLAPPEKKPFGTMETAGELLFDQIGCVKCHIPSLPGANGPVEAYTDLLLHDMGPGLADGIHIPNTVPQLSTISLATTEQEWRTAPLWGVSMSGPFLHDGRAQTLRDAIEMHGGEGDASRIAFLGLTDVEQDSIIAFLEAL